jgi:acetyltransferase-like isoleucine patch superfamily enzyme
LSQSDCALLTPSAPASTLKKGSSNIFIGFTFEKKKGPKFLKKVIKQCLDKKCNFPGFNLSEQKTDLEIGDGVQIFKNVYYDSYCRVGSYTQIRPEVRLGHNVVIEKYCYIAPGVKIGGGSIIKEGYFIGQDTVLAPNTIINKNCLIGFSSIIKKEIPENSLVFTQNKMIIKKCTDPFRFI